MNKLMWINHHPNDAGGFGVVTGNLLNGVEGFDKHLITITTKTLVPRLKEKIGDIKVYYSYEARQIKYWIDKIKPDIIFLYGAYPHITHFDKGYPEKLDIPLIIYSVTDHPPIPFGLRRVYRRADKVLVPSQYSKEVMRNALISNVDILYHGVRTDLFRLIPAEPLEEGTFIYGSVFNNNLRKQADRLFRAYIKNDKIGKIALITEPKVSSTGMIFYDLPGLAEYFEIEDKVIWNEYLSNGVPIPRYLLPFFYNQFDCHVLPSAGESGGLTYLEAMACGVPNITIDYGCARELIEDCGLYARVNDFFYTSWGKLALVDVDDLALQMRIIYEDENLRVELAKKGLERVKEFTWKKSTERLTNILTEFI